MAENKEIVYIVSEGRRQKSFLIVMFEELKYNHKHCTKSYTKILCNMNEYISMAIERLNTFLPTPVAIQVVDLEGANWIPLGLMDTYEYYTGNIAGMKTLFVGVGDTPDDVTPQIVEKHSKILARNGGMPVVFLFGHSRHISLQDILRKT
ncbi:MAG: hypothetical protein J1F42_12375 [Lachnospiraceae bacterium]|nr:hypothetical protein [Lachnospiraceae bacterium]